MSFLKFLAEEYQTADLVETEVLEENAEYQGKKVTLNKPFRDSSTDKKFGVYVKNDKGNVVKVTFGSSEMDIKRDDPERRKNFRARHNCADAKDKTSARHWSCKMWQKGKSVSDMLSDGFILPSENDVIVEDYTTTAIALFESDGTKRLNAHNLRKHLQELPVERVQESLDATLNSLKEGDYDEKHEEYMKDFAIVACRELDSRSEKS